MAREQVVAGGVSILNRLLSFERASILVSVVGIALSLAASGPAFADVSCPCKPATLAYEILRSTVVRLTAVPAWNRCSPGLVIGVGIPQAGLFDLVAQDDEDVPDDADLRDPPPPPPDSPRDADRSTSDNTPSSIETNDSDEPEVSPSWLKSNLAVIVYATGSILLIWLVWRVSGQRRRNFFGDLPSGHGPPDPTGIHWLIKTLTPKPRRRSRRRGSSVRIPGIKPTGSMPPTSESGTPENSGENRDVEPQEPVDESEIDTIQGLTGESLGPPTQDRKSANENRKNTPSNRSSQD